MATNIRLSHVDGHEFALETGNGFTVKIMADPESKPEYAWLSAMSMANMHIYMNTDIPLIQWRGAGPWTGYPQYSYAD